VSKKCLIILDRRPGSNGTSIPTGKSEPSTQDHYGARGLEGGAKTRRGNGNQIHYRMIKKKSSNRKMRHRPDFLIEKINYRQDLCLESKCAVGQIFDKILMSSLS